VGTCTFTSTTRVTIWALVAANWTPRTREQREAVERLGDECGGMLVRSLSDGAAEVLTVGSRGVYNRYVVREDGSPVIVESRPRDWRWPLGDVLGWGFGFAFAIPILLLPLNYAHVVTRDLWETVALISFVVAVLLLLAAWGVGPSPYRLMHPGDRGSDWDQVRWPEH
jgi:hypothetical protein